MVAQEPFRRRTGNTLLNSKELLLLGVLALTALLLEHGFYLSDHWTHFLGWVDVALAATCLFDYLGGFILSPKKGLYLRRRVVEGMLALLLVTVLTYSLHEYYLNSQTLNFIYYLQSEMSFSLVLVQLYLALNLGVLVLNGLRRFFSLDAPAPLLIASSYLMVIASGTLLLMLPKTVALNAETLSLQEALFTATSAVTVTGLTIVDVGTRLSLFGQSLLLFLIQIGGISLVAVVGLLAYTEGERLNLRQMKVLRTALGLSDIKDVRQMLSVVIGFTFTLEALGTLGLFAMVPEVGGSWQSHLYWSFFHSVSAFCSAGFALQSDSMMQWASTPALNLIIPILVVAGGIGFPVALDLLHRARQIEPLRWVSRRHRLKKKKQGEHHLRLQTRYSLTGAAILLTIGFLAFWILEGGAGAWSNWSVGEKFWASIFQSGVLRSAGFNTVDLTQMGMATIVIMMIAMTIGAGPISTGGGIKTVTIAILIQTLRSFLAGRPAVMAHNRTIPQRTVWAALTIFFFYLAMLCFTFFFLALVAPHIPMRDLLFEAISALGTVGLSLGATSEVGFLGQLFLMLAMFVGKIGPLTLAIGVLAGRDKTSLVKYPQEEIIVG